MSKRDSEKTAVVDLLSALDSDVTAERSAAVKALGQLKARKALPRIRTIALNDLDGATRYLALISIAQIDGAADCEVCRAALKDAYRPARVMAARGLGAFAGVEALEPLGAARSREPLLWRWVYSGAIRKINGRARAADRS